MSAHVVRRCVANRNHRITTAVSILGILALLGPLFDAPIVRIVYNPSDSLARGWYRIGSANDLRVGDIVLARPPTEAAELAARRRYLPAGVPLLKPIAAISLQLVCIQGTTAQIDGVAFATVLTADSRGRTLPQWQQCRRLSDGELFLLATTNPASFDSRYFGPISVSAVIGRARPLWTWSTP